MADDIRNDDGIQHGIDDNPHDDGKKGLELGGLGGGTVGAIAGMAAGPVGALVGALVGGTVGSIASGAAVDAVDSVDNDNTVTGIGSGATGDVNRNDTETMHTTNRLDLPGHNLDLPGNDVPGVQTGGVTTAGADTRGVTEKAADALTGDNVDDKTGGRIDAGYGVAGVGTAGAMNRDVDVNDDTIRVPVVEEELNVSKDRHQAGEVGVSKHVVEEQVNVPVSVSHEEVHVERHAVDRPLREGETLIGENETIKVPVMEETVAVSKDAHVVEEIEITKERVTEQQTVSDTVRREEVDIDNSGNITR